MSDSRKQRNKVHFDKEMEGPEITPDVVTVSPTHDANTISDVSASTDVESNKSSNSKVFAFPELIFSFTDEDGDEYDRLVKVDKETNTKEYGLYHPVSFSVDDETIDTKTCYFFVFRRHGGMWLAPGTQFSGYRHPNQTGTFSNNYICHKLLLLLRILLNMTYFRAKHGYIHNYWLRIMSNKSSFGYLFTGLRGCFE